ncbi:phytoene desaturase family protein [Ectobacillus antri]|uniref:Phytoene desaturase family protein n=1 Tax=Ectobacillus antri TaxID=2486280 RepID=A0ABT6H541_9BACI|nr:phytoene desaturase family protein [Ectobacillus antri]MDG4656699.1 phytoene desaturase family protein [Ectobacillus antri]MDG5753938.1 phytoene desaturase family protein [Ectobacillus antri]
MKKIAVIGAGPGGLAASMLLAAKGYDVEVFEKQPYIGGRNGSFQLGDYTFDIGPTFLSMPQLVEELFALVRRNVDDYLDLKELKDMYELIFDDKKLIMTRDENVMRARIAKEFPGNERGYEQFMRENKMKLDKMTPILQNPMDRMRDYLSLRVLKALPHLSLSKSLYDVLSSYFTDERLKLAFTFQSKYLGMSPWECPGAFSILSYMEHAHGIVHPIGGLNQLPKAMAKITEEYGGRIHLGKGVKELLLEGKKVTGVLLETGETVFADEVIINADFAHAMTKLVKPGVLKKYSKEKLEKKKYSCSTFMMYVGVKKRYDLPHHTIIFASDYKKNVEEITKTQLLSKDPSIYVQNACITDPTLAPEGKSALYILAPVPNNMSGINWEENKRAFRNVILKTLAEKTGFTDIEEHIEVERILTPQQWEQDLFVYEGATFNLGHQLTQMMYLRPHNRFEELDNCWLVGGGTHPGSGLPTILESAKITSRLIEETTGKVVSV